MKVVSSLKQSTNKRNIHIQWLIIPGHLRFRCLKKNAPLFLMQKSELSGIKVFIFSKPEQKYYDRHYTDLQCKTC